MWRFCISFVLILVLSISVFAQSTEAPDIGRATWLRDSSAFLIPVGGDLWYFSADGSRQEIISTEKLDYAALKLSPDGTRLIFRNEGDVWISNYPDFAPVNITGNTDLLSISIEWHPSGDYILLLSETSIQHYDVNANRLEEIISLEEIPETNNFNDAQYSPDGEFIIVNRNDLWGGIAGVPIDDIWLFDSEGKLILKLSAISTHK